MLVRERQPRGRDPPPSAERARWNGHQWLSGVELQKQEIRLHLQAVPSGELAEHAETCAFCQDRVLVLTPAEVARLPRPRVVPGE